MRKEESETAVKDLTETTKLPTIRSATEGCLGVSGKRAAFEQSTSNEQGRRTSHGIVNSL